MLSDFDDSIDDLEGAILKNPTEEQLGTLFAMKRQIMTIRKVITPQRDMIASLNAGMVDDPGDDRPGRRPTSATSTTISSASATWSTATAT